MPLCFVTGNQGKLSEARAILGDVEAINLDLPEMQDIDARKIIEMKLAEAVKSQSGSFIVEDTSLYLDALNGLPGPLIKWFMKTIGNEGLARIAESFGNAGGEAKVVIGYADGNGNVEFFEGSFRGTIVQPRGENGFGWDPIFQPEGYDKTFAEFTEEEKNRVSMRRIAFEKLRNHLDQLTA